jgi:hypothetical protein
MAPLINCFLKFRLFKQLLLAMKGKYMHYKGNEYEVIGTAIHSETEEELVVYFSMKSPEQLWVRPLKMFIENIEFNGETIKRFKKIKY